MAKQRTTFAKLQRERAKKAKAAAKRERRQQRSQDTQEDAEPIVDTDDEPELTAPQLLEKIEELHRRFENNLVEFDDFEEQRAVLFEKLAELPMD